MTEHLCLRYRHGIRQMSCFLQQYPGISRVADSKPCLSFIYALLVFFFFLLYDVTDVHERQICFWGTVGGEQ